MECVKLMGGTCFFSFFNGVDNFNIKPVLVLVSFFLETIWFIESELLYLFEITIGNVRMGSLEIGQGTARGGGGGGGSWGACDSPFVNSIQA